MTTQAQHTPTPWSVHGDGCGQIWVDDHAIAFCDTRELGEGPSPALFRANAAFIVLACNSHDQLIKAHDQLIKALVDIQRDVDISSSSYMRAWRIAEVALKAVERRNKHDDQ